jgi:hypothetical protein
MEGKGMRMSARVRLVVVGLSLLVPGLPPPGHAAPGDDPARAILHIEERSIVADGEAFGRAGAYEKLVGTIDFALDPEHPQNAIITDIEHAPRTKGGLVAYSTDFYLLMPADPSRWNHKVVYDVNNRGNKLVLGQLQDATGGNNPISAEDFGNGFLMEQGYAILWVGWEGDRLPGESIITIRVPVASGDDGAPITQEIAVEYFDDLHFPPDGSVSCLPLSGSANFHSYPAVESEMEEARLWVRDSDSPRPPGVEIPQGDLVPEDGWSFASATEVCLDGGFQGGKVYELNYVAQDPLVLGLGYAATRDAISFFRHADADEAATPNPLAAGKGVRHVLGWGASQSGAYLRDFLYQGFNEDLAGRRVMDGVQVHIAGALLGQGENYRFGQLNPWSDQHRGRIYPNVTFPFNYGVRENPLVAEGIVDGPRFDGILKRPETDPLVIQTDSSNEYRWGGASLVDTDGFGNDVELPWNVRHYLIAGTQHGAGVDAEPVQGICQQLNNPTRQAPAMRALFAALDRWVTRGVEPPESRRPTVAAGTLVPPDQASTGFPEIPGVTYSPFYNAMGEKDYGPGVRENRGVITNWHPSFLASYEVLLPKVDEVGIDLDGVRVPEAGVPIATLTGWNVRAAPYTEGDLCGLNGMYLPLPETTQEAAEAGDPRPSLEELYGSHGGYVAEVARFVVHQVRRHLLLPEDARQAIVDAAESDVLR